MLPAAVCAFVTETEFMQVKSDRFWHPSTGVMPSDALPFDVQQERQQQREKEAAAALQAKVEEVERSAAVAWQEGEAKLVQAAAEAQLQQQVRPRLRVLGMPGAQP
jgi:hypothetical protein